jgi:uncharacterized protein (DUF4415 family)
MARKSMKEFEPGHGFTKEDWNEVSDNPALTDERLAGMRPFAEIFPDLAESIKHTRGKQKTPTKQLVSIRLDRDVVAAFKATGDGWQRRINDVLRTAKIKGVALTPERLKAAKRRKTTQKRPTRAA